METAQTEQENKKVLPAKKFKAGAITATIWNNEAFVDGKIASYSTVSLQRTYKDKTGKWQHAQSFRTTDLPKVALVINEAFKELSMSQKNETEQLA